MLKFFFALTFSLVISSTVFAQQPTNNAAVLQNLLDLPAPPPFSPNAERAKQRGAEFYDAKRAPADDAPIDEILDYWLRWNAQVERNAVSRNSDVHPTETVLRRILAACQESPETLVGYLNLLPQKSEFVTAVEQLYDNETSNQKLNAEWLSSVKDWLKLHSSRFTDELLTAAQKVKDKGSNTDNEDELQALAKVDWERARPLLENLENNTTQPMSRVSAMWTIYQHALDAKEDTTAGQYRDKLKAIVENRSLPAGARDKAMDALCLTAFWNGRDEWYLSLLADETLFELKDGEGGLYTGLTTLVAHEPAEKWIPTMAKLVGSSNANIHNAAVRNLMQMAATPSRETLEPLLPWLTDANWAKNVEGERARFIAQLKEIDLPEAVPGLINIVLNENDETAAEAAQALVRYKDSRAIPALRFALSKAEKSNVRSVFFIEALIVIGGFTDDELAAAFEEFIVKGTAGRQSYDAEIAEKSERLKATTEWIEKSDVDEETSQIMKAAIANRMAVMTTQNYDGYLPVPKQSETLNTKIGAVLSESTEVSDGVITRLLERQRVLQQSNPTAAMAMLQVMRKWSNRSLLLDLLKRAGAKSPDVDLIIVALARRKILREKLPNEVAAMRGDNPMARAVGAAIAEDQNELLALAAGNEQPETQIAALAVARLLRVKLPVSAIADLTKNQNKLLALAAERYLESEDSPEAQAVVRSLHPNEVVILGARNSFSPTKTIPSRGMRHLSELFSSVNAQSLLYDESRFGALDKIEKILQTELRENQDLSEVYAFLRNQESGHLVVKIYRKRAILIDYEDAARYRERELTVSETEAVQAAAIQINTEMTPPIFGSVEGGRLGREFVQVNRTGGRRVFIFSLELAMPEPLEKFNALLADLRKNGKMTLHYYFADKIKGLQVLLDDEQQEAQAVTLQNGELRVLVGDAAKQKENEREIERLNDAKIHSDDEESEAVSKAREADWLKRRAALENAHLSWRELRGANALGNVVTQPLDNQFLSDDQQVSGDNFADDRRAWQVRTGNFEIHAVAPDADADSSLPEMRREPGKPVASARNASSGLFKMSRAQSPVLLKKGDYSNPLTSFDGRWAIAAKTVAGQTAIVRIDLQTNQESKAVIAPGKGGTQPLAFVAAQNKFLVQRRADYDKPPEFYLVDAATGAATVVKGEFRPLLQQTFRSLQPAKTIGAFWAAIPNARKKQTEIGLYDEKTLTFKPLVTLPGIEFDSMNLWVDEASGRFYFVYNGQLLALPISDFTF